jgi:hypothetical protein
MHNNRSVRSAYELQVLVRESCYPGYEPSYTEISNGCSQEVESFKSGYSAVVRTQERTQDKTLHP